MKAWNSPFKDNVGRQHLRSLWTKRLYIFLKTFFEQAEMDPTIGDTVTDEGDVVGKLIRRDDSGAFGFPFGDEGSSGVWSGNAYTFYGEFGESVLAANTLYEGPKGTHVVCYLGTKSADNDRKPTNGTIITAGKRWFWVDGNPGAPWAAWEVAEEVKDAQGNSYSPKQYALVSGKTVGDIRVPMPIPARKYMVVQQGSDTGTTDNGIVGQYPRTH